ncbi:MAG: diguanylate cyclase [Desulfobacula sp. RIFOXYB2_FULL_45_6]|nr:MAG: diguanylate cyclase [Desulfobacula sp. RIFOXYB2_FULL_45_6]
MKQTLGSLSGKVTTLFSMVFHAAKKQADHKKLTQHILALNKKQSSAEIINEVAVCLKDILNYRLFAFVLKKDIGVDVWLDPRMYKKSLENIILKDFGIENKDSLNYLNQKFYENEPEVSFDMKDLLYYEIHEENISLRLYMLAQKQLFLYHDEIVNLILQGSSVALSRQLKMEHLRDAAVIDPLTQCYNRREFENQLNRHMASAVRHRTKLSVFMFDLDHFKEINDTYGHPAGDKVLREVSAMVKENIRTGDILTRYGGEEFLAILPETDKAKAMELADRLRIKISRKVILHGKDKIKITASFGVAEMNRNADMDQLIRNVDAMLYKAKLNGRNTVMPGIIKILPDKVPAMLKENVN